MVRFVEPGGRGRRMAKRARAKGIHEERRMADARRTLPDLPERLLAVLQGAGEPLTSGQLHQAVSHGRPLALPRPRLYEALKALCDAGRVCRSGPPGEYRYRLP
jgi:hypothetical protein